MVYSENRLRHLQKFGYPNTISLATACPEYYPDAFINNDGYWVYVQFDTKIPFMPKVAFLSGDPICEPSKKEKFIHDAIQNLQKTKIVSALQVHKITADIMTKYKLKKHKLHQFGPETQVFLPYRLSSQIGTKVRQCIRQGLQVEEVVFDENHVDCECKQINVTVTGLKKMVKKEKIRFDKKEYENHKCGVVLFKDVPNESLENIVKIVEEISNDKKYEYVQEFLVKIKRYFDGKIPKETDLFYLKNSDSSEVDITGFGYYQPVENEINCHLYSISVKNQNKEMILLRSGKKKVSSEDIIQMNNISNNWLDQKLTKKEMGPPLLKPFKARHEPNRRMFVARDKENNIVGFVDFDPVNWVTIDGFVNKEKNGYYTNLIRTKKYNSTEMGEIYKHVRFMIIAAGALRFTQEGCSHLNLGLTPFSPVNYITDITGDKKLSFIDFITKKIGENKFLNNITFRFANLMKTKQNWAQKTYIPTYMIFSGGTILQMYQLCAAFITTGALGFDAFLNTIRYFTQKNLKQAEWEENI